MLNPKTVQVAQQIAEVFGQFLIDREGNVVTLEDGEGTRYLVTVESVFNPTNTDTPLPDPHNMFGAYRPDPVEVAIELYRTEHPE